AVYVLEMGEEIRLIDMARDLIRLSGFVPDEDIPITFIGLRPGEKLSEELCSDDECLEPSPLDKILRVRSDRELGEPDLWSQIFELERMAGLGDSRAVIRSLR